MLPVLYHSSYLQVYDAGENFQLCQLTYSDEEHEEGDPLWQVIVIKQDGMKASDPDRLVVLILGLCILKED